MDKLTATLSGFVVLCLCLIVGFFIWKVGMGAEKSLLALETGAFGLVTGGGIGYMAGKTKGGKHEAEE